MPEVKPSPRFRRMADQISQQQVVVPLIEAHLRAGKFRPFFNVAFRDEGRERKPDAWFHPSTHPRMPERMLWFYMRANPNDPDDWIPEQIEYENRMALIMGTAVHAFMQVCMIDAGILIKPTGVCVNCGRPHGTRKNDCEEFGAIDEAHRRRGHMDGILQIERDGWGRGLFEFKCLAPGTRVSMADGSLLPVEKVSEGDMVLAWDETSDQIVPRRVTGAWDNGAVPIWHIETRQGRMISTTDEHPFWTDRGWVFAKDLYPGDRVKVVHDGDWYQGPSGDVDEAWFLGVMVGDGGLTGQTAYFTSADLTITSEVGRFVARHGSRLSLATGSDITYRMSAPLGTNRSSLLDLLRRSDLMGKGSRGKRVPLSVWRGGPDAWAAFLSGYFDADGTVVTKGSYPHLSWSSVNRGLLSECQMLLSYLGIRSSVMEVQGRYKGEPHQSWRLLVRDAISVTRAMVVLAPRSRKGRLLRSLKVKPADPSHHLTATPGWDEVSSVYEGPDGPTIALEIDGGTHVTEGIVTHNTINPKATFGLTPNNLEWLRTKKPDYYAQVQDYLDMTGMAKAVIVFCILGFPWKLVEITVPFDHFFAAKQRAKYRRVLQMLEDDEIPDPCCAPKSKEAKACPARLRCPIGRMR